MSKRKLTRDALVEMIKKNYLKNDCSLDDFGGKEFIVDMYIDGYQGVRNYDNDELKECFEREIEPTSIKKLTTGEFQVDYDDWGDDEGDDA